MKRSVRITAAAMLLAGVLSAAACPVCESDTGTQVRQKLAETVSFKATAGLAAPVLVLACVVAFIRFGGSGAAVPREKDS